MVARKLALETEEHRHCPSTLVRGTLGSEPVGSMGGSCVHCWYEDRVTEDRSLEDPMGLMVEIFTMTCKTWT